ncbi:MAG: efflux RND transporter periplasmic adaptor subunit [Proteobacteria bacterium]|nr:efflux RND transporter periplasmic adaptor subunit [Pseudomonadota bacterium]
MKSLLVESPIGEGVRNFPGRIDSSKRADLAFRVRGKVSELLVKEGVEIKRDQILARLDQTDYKITLKDRQATWDRTSKDYERSKTLVQEGAISRRDYDAVEAAFKSADAALEQARQNLEYTHLRAPFDGQVANRNVDAFEEVIAGQTVFSIIDRRALEVQIDVAENIILALPSQTPGENRDKLDVWASFDNAPGRRFPLTFKEASNRADQQTQTFQVTFLLPPVDDVTILPGMTTSVVIDMSKLIDADSIYYLPLTAVVGDNTLASRVWVVDEDSMTVHERPVTVGRMVGRSIEVLDGLEPGLRVVTAGAAYLAEGMKVTLMKQTEQASQPRDEA